MDIKSYVAGIGGLGSVLLAITCCIAPMVLAGIGIGAGTAMVLMKIQWPVVLLSMAILGFSYITYYKKKMQCTVEGCSMKGRTLNLILLGVSTTVISILFLGLLFPTVTWKILHLLGG